MSCKILLLIDQIMSSLLRIIYASAVLLKMFSNTLQQVHVHSHKQQNSFFLWWVVVCVVEGGICLLNALHISPNRTFLGKNKYTTMTWRTYTTNVKAGCEALQELPVSPVKMNVIGLGFRL